MLKVNLGWCDTKVATKYLYNPRKYFVEASQTEGNADPVVFAVTQTGDHWTITSTSSGTFYQYGRKDPFLPMKGLWPYSTENKDSYSPAGYDITDGNRAIQFEEVSGSNDGNVSYGIQNPYVQYQRGGNYGWVSGQNRNLWDMTETSGNGQSYDTGVFVQSKDKKVVKTIYDPCPPGFSVPNYSAFTIFTSTGNNLPDGTWNPENPVTEDKLGFMFNTSDSGDETMYFPSQGYRANGTLGGSIESLYYFTSKASGTRYGLMLSHGGPMRDLSKSNAYSVRPAKEIQ